MPIVGYKARKKIERVVQTLENITPLFTHDAADIWNSSTNPDGYWLLLTNITLLEDGWAHVSLDNSNSDVRMYAKCMQKWLPRNYITDNQATLLLEIRNYESTATPGATTQVWFNPATGTESYGGKKYVGLYNGAVIELTNGNGVYRERLNINQNGNILNRFWFAVEKNIVAEFDARISIYQNNYEDEYLPYQEV